MLPVGPYPTQNLWQPKVGCQQKQTAIPSNFTYNPRKEILSYENRKF